MKSKLSARRWLHELLLQLATLATADAGRMTVHHDIAIHALRVRMKKLCAVLDLAADDPREGALADISNRVREIKRGIGDERDDYVIQHVAAKFVRGRLPVAPWVPCPAWSQPHAVQECAALVEALRTAKLPAVSWEDITKRHASSYATARKNLHHCTSSHDAEDYHRWRKSVKTLYFQSLALRQHKVSKQLVRAEARLGSKLGREHDLTLLESRLDGSTPKARKLQNRIERARRDMHSRLLRTGERVFSESPKKFKQRLRATRVQGA